MTEALELWEVPWEGDGLIAPSQLQDDLCDHEIIVEWTRDGGGLVYSHDGDLLFVIRRQVVNDPLDVLVAMQRILRDRIVEIHGDD